VSYLLEAQMGHCHCTMYRKFHGAAFSTFGEAKTENFHWIKGEDNLKNYLVPNGTHKQFYNNRGSSLVFIPSYDTDNVVEFSLGTLDTTIMLKPDAHIFTKNCASWYEIKDDLPQFSAKREAKKS